MNKQIWKKINFAIFEMILLIFIIYRNSVILYCNNNNNSLEFSQNERNKTKTFEFLIENQFSFSINKKINLDYDNINFAVIRRVSCSYCGLLSNYIVYLGCIRKYLIEGFIPILELESYKNVINGFKVDPSKENPWEYYFNQPFSYKYSDIKKKARNIKYFECKSNINRPREKIFLNKESMKFWHLMANKYIPIKNAIINESNNIIKRIFKGSKNVLGVLLRGTDYIARKPHRHPIPPNTKDVINDTILLDKKNKYDWIFLATEDNIIRHEFIKAIGNKVKCLLNKMKVSYNYNTKKLLAYNINFKNNIEFNKIYLLIFNYLLLTK